MFEIFLEVFGNFKKNLDNFRGRIDREKEGGGKFVDWYVICLGWLWIFWDFWDEIIFYICDLEKIGRYKYIECINGIYKVYN